MAKTKATRLREQRERQAEVRKAKRENKQPGRDDIARIALRWLIVTAARLAELKHDPKLKNKVEDILLEELGRQGFDPVGSDKVLEDLIRKYTKGGWDFRRKLHLLKADQ